MSYADELQDLRWFAKRHWILQRDKFSCKGNDCRRQTIYSVFKVSSIIRENQNVDFSEPFILVDQIRLSLQVHHTYYVQNKRPWEYLDSALITLCPDCHKREHQHKTIPILNSVGISIT